MDDTPQVPEDVHEWISFDDPDEHRTWVFDATFLRSRYTCIYGRGCEGILDQPSRELAQGCCSHGAHFTDADDEANLLRHAARVRPDQMQFHEVALAAGTVTDGEPDSDGSPTRATRLADDACIFLNRPGFAGGTGCALHIAAEAAGERPMDWKPQVCWQLPVRLEHSQDESGHVTSRLREWKRRDWGAGGAEFAWWCTEEPAAFVGDQPVYLGLRDEIIGLVGADVYATLRPLLERQEWVPLTHPVVRR